MFDHVTIRAADRDASERFYNTVLQTLGIDESYRTGTFSEWQDFGLTAADAEHPPTRGLHIGFAAPDHERVRYFWQAREFYETVAPHAGLRRNHDTPGRVQFVGQSGSFSLLRGTPTRHLHMAFPTEDDLDVERFHQAAIDAGFQSNGVPAERPRYHPGYYAAYVLDPDGNNIEVVNHHRA